MKIIDFKPWHATVFDAEGQPELSGISIPDNAQSLVGAGPCFTGTDDNDTIVGCGGLAQIWPGRYLMWALLSKESGKHMVSITKMAKRLLRLCEGRIEVIVRSDYQTGERWVQMLGFEWHHHEELFLPGGHDADIYMRFQ